MKDSCNVENINAKIFQDDEVYKVLTQYRNKTINYDSIFLCVGRRSQLTKELIGKRIVNDDLNDIAFTSIIKHNLNITNSKQYFLKEGPLAILPINKKEFSLVWSVSKNYKLDIMQNLIREKLKRILGLDNKISISKIDFFPISFNFNVLDCLNRFKVKNFIFSFKPFIAVSFYEEE